MGVLSSSDPDVGNSFDYSFVSGTGDAGNSFFDISGGNLYTIAPFDFETKSEYSIRIKTSDEGGLSDYGVFLLSIGDAEDQPVCQKPVFSSDGLTLRWSSFFSQKYTIFWASNLQTNFVPLIEEIDATPPQNEHVIDTQGNSSMFLKIGVGE